MCIKAFYREILGVADENLVQQIADETKVIRLKKGEMLIRAGDNQEYVPFLYNGILRGFFFDGEGRDITDCFITRCGEPSMACFDLNTPQALINVEALSDSEVFVISNRNVMELLRKNPQLVYIYNKLLLESLESHWKIKTVVSQKTALERYNWFLKVYPGLINQICNKHIASFLGMTPVTLSRLRHTIRLMDQKRTVEQ